MVNAINLTAGTVDIPLVHVPYEIAKALLSTEQAAKVRITSVYKASHTTDPNDEAEEEALTNFDWFFLNGIFKAAKLPQPVIGINGMDGSEWPKYQNAIDENIKSLGDEYMGTRITASQDTVINILAREHFKQLIKAIALGNATAYNKTSRIKMEQVTNEAALEEAYMTVDDLALYAKGYGIEVQVGGMVVGQSKTLEKNTPPIIHSIESQSGKLDQQEHAILNWFKRNKIDPLKCPASPKGTRGMRSKCREGLQAENKQLYDKLFKNQRVYELAYQRLLRDKLIINGE